VRFSSAHPPAFDDADALGPTGNGAVVGDNDEGQPTVAPERFERVDNLVTGFLVEISGGLVRQQDRR